MYANAMCQCIWLLWFESRSGLLTWEKNEVIAKPILPGTISGGMNNDPVETKQIKE